VEGVGAFTSQMPTTFYALPAVLAQLLAEAWSLDLEVSWFELPISVYDYYFSC
jgi:hypothetical protein